MELGEIYSLACDTDHVITGHTLTNSSFKIWKIDNFEVVKIIKVRRLLAVPLLFQDISLKENCNQSIIWNIHLVYPLALICRDNESLDLYNLQTAECAKTLKHESKVRKLQM